MSASSKKKLRKEQEAANLTEKQLAEQKEAKKLKAYTITFVAIMALVVIVGLSTIIGNLVSRSGIIERGTTALTLNDKDLSAAELSYYYIDGINQFIDNVSSQNPDYASLILQYNYGLDLTKPLNKQQYMNDPETTWADFFINSACDSAKSMYALYELAVKDGHQLNEEDQKVINDLPTTMNNKAKLSGFASTGDYLKAMYGNGASLESFTEYVRVSALANSYYNAHADSLKYDDAAIRAYEKDHFNEFSSYSLSYYYLSSDKFLTGGTKDESGVVTYTDEEKADSLKAAEEAANGLLKNTTLDLLNTAIKALEINKDNTSAAATTLENALYSDTSIPEVIRKWLDEAERKQGDIAVVPNTTTSTDAEGNEKTLTSGYYVVLFDSVRDNNSKMANVRHILFSFEGGTKDSDGKVTYSDEEKAAAKKQADDLLAQWLAGDATEESFIALVHDNTDDSGSKENGGLYEDINEDTTFVEPFLEWALADHKPGDAEVIETEYGYHVMYYSSTDELTYRDAMISNTLKSEAMEAWYEDVLETVTVTKGNTNSLRQDLVLSSGSSN